jgi:hypothetical protein
MLSEIKEKNEEKEGNREGDEEKRTLREYSISI